MRHELLLGSKGFYGEHKLAHSVPDKFFQSFPWSFLFGCRKRHSLWRRRQNFIVISHTLFCPNHKFWWNCPLVFKTTGTLCLDIPHIIFIFNYCLYPICGLILSKGIKYKSLCWRCEFPDIPPEHLILILWRWMLYNFRQRVQTFLIVKILCNFFGT